MLLGTRGTLGPSLASRCSQHVVRVQGCAPPVPSSAEAASHASYCTGRQRRLIPARSRAAAQPPRARRARRRRAAACRREAQPASLPAAPPLRMAATSTTRAHARAARLRHPTPTSRGASRAPHQSRAARCPLRRLARARARSTSPPLCAKQTGTKSAASASSNGLLRARLAPGFARSTPREKAGQPGANPVGCPPRVSCFAAWHGGGARNAPPAHPDSGSKERRSFAPHSETRLCAAPCAACPSACAHHVMSWYASRWAALLPPLAQASACSPGV